MVRYDPPSLIGPVTALVGRAGVGKGDMIERFKDLEDARLAGTTQRFPAWEPTPRQIQVFPWIDHADLPFSALSRSQQEIATAIARAWCCLARGEIAALDPVACHPRDGAALLQNLYHLAGEHGGQIVIVVNCPVQLDQIRSLEDVICLKRTDEGTIWRRLSEHPEAARWSAYRTGEVWSTVGEEWVGGGP